jgi:predicted secreted protein
MAITSALVLFAVIWFLVLFITLPIGLKTQGDVGEIVPGTQAGSPANLNIRRKFRIVTLISAVLWVIIAGTIISGAIGVCDFDWFGNMADQCAARQAG